VSARWDAFWYAPTAARNLAVARVLLAGTALWMVLSRVDLPSVMEFPAEMWSGVGGARGARFFLGAPLVLERTLYAALHATLVAALFGLYPRLACFASGLLLYHFAPFETIIRSPNPYLRGLTIPTLGLLILSFAPRMERWRVFGEAAAEATPAWPLRLVQVLLCQIYFFAGYAKLVTSGLAWPAAENVRRYLLLLNQGLSSTPAGSLGYAVADLAWACALLGWCALAFELAFPLVLFSRAARLVLLPLAVLFHLGNGLLFRIFFQNVFLLLVFVDWDRRGSTR
jgi:HTTM domain